MFAADLDADGDQDVLSTSFYGDAVAWHANDGAGGFSTYEIISADTHAPACGIAVDIDGDSALDVLLASAGDDRLSWYKNFGLSTAIVDERPRVGPWLFPDPMEDHATVVLASPPGRITVQVLDAQGRIVRSEGLFPVNDRFGLERSGLPSGAYVLRVLGAGRQDALRFLVHC